MKGSFKLKGYILKVKRLHRLISLIDLSGIRRCKMSVNPKDDCLVTSGMAGCFWYSLDNLNVRGEEREITEN